MLPFQKQKKHNNTFILQVRLFKGERWNTPPPPPNKILQKKHAVLFVF